MTPERPLALRADALVEQIAEMIYSDVQCDSSLWPELEEYRKQDYRHMATKAIALSRAGADREAELVKALERIAVFDGGPFGKNPSTVNRLTYWSKECLRVKDIAVAALKSVGEMELLRARQAALVMQRIGGLLDAWERVPNDFRGVMLEECSPLCRYLDDINTAMEGAALSPQEQDDGR